MSGKIHRDGPQGKHGESLVGPGEIAPQNVELDEHECGYGSEYGQRDHDALAEGGLAEMQQVGHDEPRGPQGGVAGADGSGHDAEDGEHASNLSEPAYGDVIDERSGIAAVGSHVVGKL